MATVVAFLPDRHAQAVLTAAMRGRGRAVFCDDDASLLTALVRERPDVVLIALRDVAGTSTAPTIRAVHTGFPATTIVGYCGMVTPAAARDVMLATQAGVGELVISGAGDELADLRAILDGAARDTLGAEVVRDFADVLPAKLAPFFRYCLANAHHALSVEDLADAMAVHRKTLAHRLAQVGFPAPSTVVGWCRLTLAARLMEDPARSTEQIAAELEFASGAALRNMLMRYTGLRPRDVRARGGAVCVLDALRRSLTSSSVHTELPPDEGSAAAPDLGATPAIARPRTPPGQWALRGAALWDLVSSSLWQFVAEFGSV